jgi:hypothetical protein
MNSFEGCVSYFTLVREFREEGATPQGYVRSGPKADMDSFRPRALICSLSVQHVISGQRTANALKRKIAKPVQLLCLSRLPSRREG